MMAKMFEIRTLAVVVSVVDVQGRCPNDIIVVLDWIEGRKQWWLGEVVPILRDARGVD